MTRQCCLRILIHHENYGGAELGFAIFAPAFFHLIRDLLFQGLILVVAKLMSTVTVVAFDDVTSDFL